MTLQMHHAAARELWNICHATRRLWLYTGDVEGVLKPEGKALSYIRKLRDKLCKRFARDFPGQHNPYEDIEC